MNLTTILWAIFVALIFMSWPILAKYSGAGAAWCSFIIYSGGLITIITTNLKDLKEENLSIKALVIMGTAAIVNGLAVWVYMVKCIDKTINTSLFIVTCSLGGIIIAPLLNWVINSETLTNKQWTGIAMALIVIWLMKK